MKSTLEYIKYVYVATHTERVSKALNLSYKWTHKSRQSSVTIERPED